MAYHPEIQHAVAEMALALDPIEPHIEKVAEDWSDGVDHGGDLAGEDRLGQVPRGRGVLADRRSRHGGVRRRRHVPRQRTGTAVPRRPLRPLPSGEHLPDARDRRQDRAGHRPRRAAALGVEGERRTTPSPAPRERVGEGSLLHARRRRSTASRISGMRSLPKYMSSPPTNMVGEPKPPRSISSCVLLRSLSLFA